MKKHKLQEKFLEELMKTPIVQHACERVGISRNTYYRWIKENIDFSLAADECLKLGIGFVNDHAESNILNGIKKGEMRATTYWLSHRHKEYRKPFIIRNDTSLIEENHKLEMIQSQKEVDIWIEGWTKNEKVRQDKKAIELFEEWKEEEIKRRKPKVK